MKLDTEINTQYQSVKTNQTQYRSNTVEKSNSLTQNKKISIIRLNRPKRSNNIRGGSSQQINTTVNY